MMNLLRRAITGLIWAAGYCTGLTGPQPHDLARPLPTAISVWGLVVGLILSGVFALSWKYFGDIYFTEDTRLRLVPSAMVLVAISILNLKQLAAVAITADQVVLREPPGERAGHDPLRQCSIIAVVAVVLAILLKFSALLAMRHHALWRPGDWRRVFNPIYPRIHARVLVLLGLWGKAGLLIAAGTGSQHPNIRPADRALRQALRIRTLVFNLAAVTVMTTVYFSTWRNRALGLLVSLFVFVVVYLASMLISRRQGGHDGWSMFACAELGELALLLGYLVIAKYL